MRLLFLDIETSAHEVNTWGLFNQNIGLNQLITPSRMLCWSAIWYGEKQVMFEAAWDGPKAMIANMHKLLDEADIVCGYNTDRFDLPAINRELILAGYRPPSPYKKIDLLRTVRRQFRFASNKLAFVAKALGIGEKVKHPGYELWLDVIAGDERAQRLMKRYCIQDTKLLVKLYEKLKPWIKSPNIGLIEWQEHACPNCASGNVHRRGFAMTATYRYARWQCQECGAWSRSAMTEKPTHKNKLVSIQ